MRKNSVKNRRVNDEVQRALAEIVREVKDPRISPLTSVTGTEVAPDLKTCKVYISVYGDAEAGKRTMEGLHSAARFIAYGVAMSHRIDEVTAMDREAELKRGEEPNDTTQDDTL